MTRAVLAAGLLAIAAAGAACEDPSKGKTKAVTGEAQGSTQGALAANVVDYTFDQNDSKVAWAGSKVTGKHEGSFQTFRGIAHVAPGAPEKSSVEVDIDAASITTDSEKLVGHLKSADFFDVAKFPKATFASTSIAPGGKTVTGNLTLHGVTRSITFPADVKIAPDGVSVDAEFAINRKDFAINYPGKQDDLIRDDVVIKLTIRAKKRAA